MSPEPGKAKVRIGSIPVTLPIHIDMETTGILARQVEERLKRIEDESDIIDTQRFAVQAAYEFAAELYDLEEMQEQDTRDLVKALERIATQLRELEKRFHLGPRARDEQEEGEEE